MKLTRRNFLEASAAAPLAAGLVTTIGAAPNNVLSEAEREALHTAMDQIIPAGDGMPSASEAGGLEYLQRVARQEPEVANQLRSLLAELKERKTLTEFEAKDPQNFAHLRDYVYEAYYTQPRIWKLIGYHDYPTDHAGPHLPPFDESLLDPVRNRPKLYREA
jgi:hypothetical protein